MTAPSHIVVVTLENQNYGDIVGNTAQAPFLNSLISQGMLFTNYIALSHPSQPNYLALFSGSMQGITDDTVPPQFSSSVPTLASALATKGLTFTGYADTGVDLDHTPWRDFANSAALDQNFSTFPTDFNNLPTVSFVAPNNNNNMHDGTIGAGDAWVAANLGAYAAWAEANNSLLIVTFDESGSIPYPNRAVTIVVGAGVPAGIMNDQPANPYALLATIENLYGLTPIGESAGAPNLDFYSTTPPTAATSLATSLSGISDPTTPPEGNALAVGGGYIVSAEGSQYEVSNLTGGSPTTGSLYSLFSSLGSTFDRALSDVRVAFDSSTGRFVLIANNRQPNGSTNIDIAVSNSSNPADGWSVASLDTSNGGTTQSDVPFLSVAGGQIYLTAPQNFISPYGNAGAGAWVISESSIISGSMTVSASQTADPSVAPYMRGVAGDNGVAYYVSAYSSGAQTKLALQTYTAAGGFSAIRTLSLGNSDQGHGASNFSAQQPGTSLALDAGNSRIEGLVYSNGYLYGVSEVLPTGASAPQIHWFKLDVSNPSSPQLVVQGDLSGSLLGDPSIALFNASIAVDGNGDVLINFTASGPNMYPSDYYVVQGANASTFGAPTLYQASTSSFSEAAGASGLQSWGPNSTAIADPNNPNGFWISNEYVTSTGVTVPAGLGAWWDTAIAQVQVALNEPLLADGGATSPTYLPSGSPVLVDASLTVSDVGSSTLSGATVKISGGFVAGDQLNFTNQAGIVGSYNSSTGALTLSGSATLAAYQTALQSITFSSSNVDPTAAGADPVRTITWTATDGVTTSWPFTSTLNISVPSLTITTAVNGPLTLTPSDNPVLITGSGSVTATNTDAIDGGSGSSWQILNAGTISSTSAYGVNLAGFGSVTNSGSISGNGGVLLNNYGAVTNSSSGTITATGMMPMSLATISGIYVKGPSGGGIGTILVNNAGVVNAADGYGIGLGASGSVINSGQITGGEDGIIIFSGTGEIENSGRVVATLDDGATLFAGGTVTNAVGGFISGDVGVDAAGIFVTGGLGTINNSGEVVGSHYGILLAADGIVTNNSTGTITGQNSGVFLSHGGSLSNKGDISSTAANSAAADLELGGSVINFLGGSISGTAYGAFVAGAQGSVINSGSISATTYYGVSLTAGGSVENDATGSIVGQTAGVNLSKQSATVVNSGSISAIGSGGAAVSVNAGGSVTNNSGGTLSGVNFGVFAYGAPATFSNAGLATGRDAVGFTAGGSVVNLAGGTLLGQNTGVFVAGASGTVTNSGTISAAAAGDTGIDLEAGGTVTNNAGGTITGGAYGVFATGGSGAVTNLGSISGGAYAVLFSMNSSANLVQVGANASFSGAVYGNGGTLELLSGAGSIAGISGAGQFNGFQSLVVDSGANWSLGGSGNSIANLTVDGALTVTGSLAVTGAVDVGSAGVLSLNAGAVLELAADAGSQAAVDFQGASQLKIDNAALFGTGIGTASYQGSLLENFGVGDSIDVLNFAPATASFAYDPASGLLQISNGSQQATLKFQDQTLGGGTFQLAADASGAGTLITFVPGVTGVAISGTAAFVSGNLDSYQASLPASITITDNLPLTVTVGQITSDASALSVVTNANGTAYGLTVSDTAVHVAASLDALNTNSHVSSIALTDAGTPALTLTVAQALNDTAALGKITTPYTIAVSDSVANVLASLDALNADNAVTSIALTDPGAPTLTFTIATALADARAIGEITTPHTNALADTAANIASLTSAQVAALKAAGYVSIASTTGTVAMPVAEAQLLTSNGISVTGAPLVATGAVTAMLALTAAQASSLSAAGYALQVVDTAAHIQALTAAQIAGLANLHVVQLTATDTNVGVTVAQASGLEVGSLHVSAPAGSAVTVTDISLNLQAMSVSLISGLPTIGVSSIVSTNGSVKISVAQAQALETAALRITKPGGLANTVTVSDLAANIASLTAAQISLLTGVGVTGISATDTGITLNLAQTLALESVKLKVSVPSGYKATASDIAANVGALTAAQITGLPLVGVTAVVVSDPSNLTLTVAQATALESAKVTLSLQSGAYAVLSDTAANIAKLTATQIAGLVNLHVTQIQASDTNASLTTAQATALETANIPVSAPAGSAVQILDAAGRLQALTVAQINALPAIGVSRLVSSNAGVRFTVAQTIALEAGALTVTPYVGTKVTVWDTGANIGTLAPAQISALAPTGFGGLASNSGGVALSVAQTLALEGVALKITAPSGSKVTVSDQAANIQAMSASQVAALSAAGVSGVTATDGSVTLSLAQAVALESPVIKVTAPAGSTVSAADTAANIAALTTTQIAGLKSIGVTALSGIDANVALTVAQATALETAGVSLSPPTGGSDAIVDTAAHIRALTATQIAGLGNLHVTQIQASDTSANLTVAQAVALETANIAVSAPGGSVVQISDTAAHLQALTVTQINALPGIGVTGLMSSNANVLFNASQTSAILAANLDLSAAGTYTVGETFTSGAVITSGSDGSGGGKLTLSTNANGVTVSDGASSLSVTSGSQTIGLTDYGKETITATSRTNETFAFSTGFGNDTIIGFAATGTGHDLIQFEASMFSYLTPGMSQAAEIAAVLSHATTSGSNTTIVDSTGDSLTLNSVSVATLSANPADFKFV